ncbi:MAG: hypothetical protein JWO67_3706 [Streptosporangiaceae bacterium]|nr:hypothetical protein [Streptosporangiaceae bacterium]
MTLMNTASFADRVADQLRGWPALSVCPVDSGTSSGFALDTHQIVHLHSANEAELYLTWPVIQRMHKVLRGSGQVMLVPGEEWVRVHLDSDSDVRVLMSLVSVAIQANVQPERRRRPSPCPKSRLATV